MPKLIFDNCKKHLKGQQFPEADFTYGQLTATKLNRKMHLTCRGDEVFNGESRLEKCRLEFCIQIGIPE